MKFKSIIKEKLSNALRPSVDEILVNIRESKNCILQKIDGSEIQGEVKGLTLLPGCEYVNYAIPMDYMPSRNLKPRWGGTQNSPIPEIYDFFATCDKNYEEMLAYMKGLDLSSIETRYQGKSTPAWIGGAISAFDACALYAMVQKFQPQNYVEIGSGMTTLFARQAIKDAGLSTKIISIDPEPRMEIEEVCDEVFRDGLEIMDLSKLSFLDAGDILFLDGSHRSFMNSDVTVFFIDILPKLKNGVIIHLHDIHLPWDYDDMFTNWYWNEQYMLAVCFLNGMEKIEPLFPTRYICKDEKFDAFFEKPLVDLGEYNDSWRGGGSMWFRFK